MRRLNPVLILVVVALALTPACNKGKVSPDADGGPPAAEQPDAADSAASGSDSEEMGAEGFADDSDLQAAEDLGAGMEEDADAAAGRNPLQTIFFAFDSSALSDVALTTLEENAAWMKQHPDARVVIEGHCDDRGTTEYNLELGARRARSVRDHLGRLGVDVAMLETISYGEERPASEGSGESAWSQNRRAEFRMESR